MIDFKQIAIDALGVAITATEEKLTKLKDQLAQVQAASIDPPGTTNPPPPLMSADSAGQ
jgi:hypothetical protein